MPAPVPAIPRAVILLSGGLDSATALAVAKRDGFECHTLTLDYGQRHALEKAAAGRVARSLSAASHTVIGITPRAFSGSALTSDIDVPKDRPQEEMAGGIPITYVPARNLVFLSLAVAYAETMQSRDIFIGVNAIDYSGYPDCRPEFIQAFEHAANLGTKSGVEGRGVRIHTPLIDLSKADIIRLGASLGVDYSLTHSCYDPIRADGRKPAAGGTQTPEPAILACGRCDSCQLRREGFRQAGIPDPTPYGP